MTTKKTKATKTTKTTKTAKKKAPVVKARSKKDVIKKHSTHTADTGSSHVQVALLTEQINSLSAHLEAHPKDNHSRRGLIGLVGKRREHLQYLKMKRPEDYENIKKALKLRK